MKRIAFLSVLTLLMTAFVVDSTTAKKYRKKSEGAWLGVTTQSVNDDLVEGFDLTVDYGAIINDVIHDSPADEAGLEDGDVIIAFNGEKVITSRDLIEILEDMSGGDKVDITLRRDDDDVVISVTLGDKNDNMGWINVFPAPRGLSHNYSFYSDDPQSYIGVQLTELTTQLGEYFGVRKGRGVLVTEVEEDSPASEAGLKAGDVITSVDNDEVEDYDDVRQIISDFDKGDKVKIGLMRDHREMEISVTVDERDSQVFGSHNWSSFGNLNIQIPNIPPIPRIRGFSRGSDPDVRFFLDGDELSLDLKELRRELEEMKKEFKVELKEIHDKLD